MMTKDQQNLNVTFNRKLTVGERPADSEQNLNKTLTENQQILNKTFKIKLTDDKRYLLQSGKLHSLEPWNQTQMTESLWEGSSGRRGLILRVKLSALHCAGYHVAQHW